MQPRIDREERMRVHTDKKLGEIILTGDGGLYEVRLAPTDALRLAGALIERARALQPVVGRVYEPRESRT